MFQDYTTYRKTLGNNVDNFTDNDIEKAFKAGQLASLYFEPCEGCNAAPVDCNGPVDCCRAKQRVEAYRNGCCH